MWRIRSRTQKDRRGHPKYWSDEVGWTWLDLADIYTDTQKDMRTLPRGGEWEAV